MNYTPKNQRYVVCIQNDDCEDIEILKIYRVIPDEKIQKKGLLRVIDESGEDYLYPNNYFTAIELSKKIEDVFSLENVESIA